MRSIVFSFLFLVSSVSFGQKYLNDTTLFGERSCIFNSVCEVDSGLFVMGSSLGFGNGQYSSLFLVFFDKNKNVNVILKNYDTLNRQAVNGGINKLFLNDRENFLYYFKNQDTVKSYTRLKEISAIGEILVDIKLDTLAPEGVVDFNDCIQKTHDSSYVMTLNSDKLIYVHLDKNFNLIHVHYFEPSNPTSNYRHALLEEAENGEIVIAIDNTNGAAPGPNQRADLDFYRLDASDQIIDFKNFADGPKISMPLGLCRSQESGYFFTYTRDSLVGNYWRSFYYLCKVDENFEPVWKLKIEPILINTLIQYALQQEIKPTLDNNYIVGGAFQTDESVAGVGGTISAAVLRKFTEEGEILWQRYIYLPKEPTETVGIEIKDVIATRDSGYCMVGQRHNMTATNAGLLGQKGYIVKTNCLGYLGSPEAAAQHTVGDDFEIKFYNSSTQARSYRWFFGDGSSQSVGLKEDSIIHRYSGFGTYEVMLIAYGCAGDNDTLRFSVSTQKQADPNAVTNGNGFFNFFPNPVQKGNDFYVYLKGLNPENGLVWLQFTALDGRQISQIQLTANEGSYLIQPNLASAMYVVSLIQGEKVIQSRRLMILK